MGKNTETVELLIKRDRDDDILIEIPKSWKITFGWVNPSGQSKGSYSNGHCLRIWDGTKLRAVLNDVISFRDTSIPLIRKVTKEMGDSEWTNDSLGNFSRTENRTITHELLEEN